MPVMITNGGNHSAETHAMRAAEVLFPAEADVIAGREMEAATLRLAIAKALSPHHEAVSAAESDEPSYDAPIDTSAAAAAALSDVRALAAGTPFAAFFDGAEPERRALSVLTTHFNTTAHVDRQYWAKEEGTDEAKAFLGLHHA